MGRASPGQRRSGVSSKEGLLEDGGLCSHLDSHVRGGVAARIGIASLLPPLGGRGSGRERGRGAVAWGAPLVPQYVLAVLPLAFLHYLGLIHELFILPLHLHLLALVHSHLIVEATTILGHHGHLPHRVRHRTLRARQLVFSAGLEDPEGPLEGERRCVVLKIAGRRPGWVGLVK